MAVKFVSGLPQQMDSLVEGLVIAVDLGFSRSSRSCGVAWRDGSGKPQSEELQFGECINRILALLNDRAKAVLIIEAPLSAVFSAAGNPVERGEFERRAPNAASTATRYWYCGAGAATCLAAVFFLRQLTAKIDALQSATSSTEIFLYEGFVTFKGEATEHISDAKLLLDCFFGVRSCSVFELEVVHGRPVIAMTDVAAGLTDGSVAPAIIAPRMAAE